MLVAPCPLGQGEPEPLNLVRDLLDLVADWACRSSSVTSSNLKSRPRFSFAVVLMRVIACAFYGSPKRVSDLVALRLKVSRAAHQLREGVEAGRVVRAALAVEAERGREGSEKTARR